MPREEPHDGSEAKLAEHEEGSAGEEGGEGKRDECGGDDRLRVVFPDYFGDFACENVEERLPGRQTIEGHFLWQGGDRGRHTTTSIIMLPFPPAKLLPPNVNTSCAMIVL